MNNMYHTISYIDFEVLHSYTSVECLVLFQCEIIGIILLSMKNCV